jgi:hypothetical protein
MNNEISGPFHPVRIFPYRVGALYTGGLEVLGFGNLLLRV